MIHLRTSVSLILLMAAMAVVHSVAFAFTTPSNEEWAELERQGKAESTRQWMRELSDEVSTVPQLSIAEKLQLIDEGYGLPTQIFSPGQAAGSMRVNFDSNEVIDERDILGMGFDFTDKNASTTVPHGSPKGLTILLKFTDQAPTDKTFNSSGTLVNDVNHDAAWADNKWYDQAAPPTIEDCSVSNYYDANSGGRLTLDGDVFNNGAVCDADGWITCNVTRASITNSTQVYNAIENALQQADPHIDYSNYDSNNDGFIDGLTVIYAGASNSSTIFWHFRFVAIYMTADGVTINSGIFTGEQAQVRIWCHEFGHELGLPDLYDTGGSPAVDGVGQYGLMAGWYTGQGTHPQFMTGWSRLKLRFVDPVDIPTTTSLTGYTLSRVTQDNPGDTLLRVWRNGAPGPEYFLVEYRDGTHSWDSSLFGNGGLCYWHIDETLTSAINRDNAFDPQRVHLECAGSSQDPMQNDACWYDGFNGADAFDYFADNTTPNAHDNDGDTTEVRLEPTSGRGAATMTLDIRNNNGATIPTLSFDSPANGATVSGDVTFDVTSNAANRVEYFVDGCLKHVENGPGPYSGFSWNTRSALDTSVELRAVAYNSSGNDPVRSLTRTVTVSNGQQGGESMIFTENFNGYSSVTDSTLLNLWNLHDDNMGMEFQLRTDPAYNDTGKALAFAQTSFPTPNNGSTQDPNAGVYQGQDDDWLMTPRIGLFGYTDVKFKMSTAFRIDGAWGEAMLVLQVSDDDGATWDDLQSFNWWQDSNTQWYTGWWRNDGGTQDFWADRTVNIDPSYINKDVYFRLLFIGGRTYNVGFAVDEIQVTGTPLPLSLSSVSPDRAKVGDSVTLTGAGFGDTQGSGEVRFSDGAGGHVVASITSWTNTQIVCTVPGGAKSDANGVWVYQNFTETSKLAFTVILAAPNLQGLDQI
ncbi:MAG: M6 family metalloprotease domain-containing protein [Planctomycetales bacterium]|nr:M6 family metalloprotease domain-containing protein [bacterium]UNM07265.1 MAG: M6 family metalloprotease domain-containing protein [Planctomycetales bacterium]